MTKRRALYLATVPIRLSSSKWLIFSVSMISAFSAILTLFRTRLSAGEKWLPVVGSLPCAPLYPAGTVQRAFSSLP
ncbi:hypothetical protein GQ53DRAFT_752364 [Thozetella sp. PMI_491]|nr:hypothetical protein GQ53DRAFT_752364 [Thozetella sp. PMI_491]